MNILISNDKYTVIMDIKGNGYSKYKNYLISRYTFDESNSIYFFIKNIKNKKIWSINNRFGMPDKYEITYTEASNKIKREDSGIESNLETTISPEKPVEIRKLELINHNIEDETLEMLQFRS